MASVKRRKRRVLPVHDMTEPEPDDLPLSSDDYAASSADISSSSSSNEDNSDAVCRQHAGRSERPSDQGSASVSFIPTSVPLGGGSSEDASTEAEPVSFSMQSGCSNIDSSTDVNDVTDAARQSEDAGQPLEATSPTLVDSERILSVTECAVSLKFTGNLVQSETLVVDAPASCQSWMPMSTALMSRPHDVLVLTEQASDYTVLSISSTEERCVPCSKHGEFNTDAVAYCRPELLPFSGIASDVSTDCTSLRQETATSAAVSDVISCGCSSPKMVAVSESILSNTDELCHGMQQGKDLSNDSAEVLRVDGPRGHSSVCPSVSCQPNLQMQDTCASDGSTDLAVGDDAFVETARVEADTCSKHSLDVHLAGHVAINSDVEGSQNTEEQCMQRDDSSAVSLPDRFDEVIDGCIECESNAEDSLQPGIESAPAVGIKNGSVDEVIGATNQATVRAEDFMPMNGHNLREGKPSAKSAIHCGNCKPADDGGFHSPVLRPRHCGSSQCQTGLAPLTSGDRATSVSLSQLHLWSCDSDNNADISLPDSQQEGRIDCGSFTTTDLLRLRPVSAEAIPPVQQPLESASWERQNHSGDTDLHETGDVSLDPVTWSSASNENVGDENFHGADVVVFSVSSEPECEVCASPGGSQSETCKASSAERLPTVSCLEQERKPYATVLHEDYNSEKQSLPCITSHSHIAVDPTYGRSDLQPEVEMEDNIIAPGWLSHDQLKQEAHRHHPDVLVRDLLHVQECSEVGLPSDGKVSKDDLLASLTAVAGTHCNRTQTENLPGSVGKESVAGRAENTEDWCVGTEVVQEPYNAVSVKQLQPFDASSSHLPVECASIDVTETQNDSLVHIGPQILCFATVDCCEPEMIAEVAGGCSSVSSLLTAHEEGHLTACRQWRNGSSASKNEATSGQGRQQSGVSAYVGQAVTQSIPGSDDYKLASDVDVSAQDIDSNDVQMSECRASEANHDVCLSGISDSVHSAAPDVQQAYKFHSVVGLRETDDWADTDTCLAEYTTVLPHSDVDIVSKAQQFFASSSDEARDVDTVVDCRLQLRPHTVSQPSVADVKDAREESTSFRTQSVSLVESGNVLDDKYVADDSGEENKMSISSGVRWEHRHLTASEIADQSLNVAGRAHVEMWTETKADRTLADVVHAHSFSDRMSLEAHHRLPDQLAPDSESSSETVFRSEDSRSKPAAGEDEVDNTETGESSAVNRSYGEASCVEHCSSTVSELADTSLLVSKVYASVVADQQLSKNNMSHDVSSVSQADEEIPRSNGGTGLLFENSGNDENVHSDTHVPGMIEGGATVNARGFHSISVDSVNGESGRDNDLDADMDAELCERGGDRPVEIAGSYLERSSESRVSVKVDSCENNESSEEIVQNGAPHDEQQVIPADNLPASVTQTPGQHSLVADHLHGVLSVSVDRTEGPLKDQTSLASSRFESETLTDALENISNIDCVIAELGHLAASGDDDSGRQIVAIEQMTSAVLDSCDTNIAVSTVLSGINAVLHSEAVSQLANLDRKLHQDISEHRSNSGSSGGLSVSGPSTAEILADCSVPDETVGQAFCCRASSSGLSLSNNHDQHKAVDEKLEDGRKEIVPELSMKAVSGDCVALDSVVANTKSVSGGSVMSAMVIGDKNTEENDFAGIDGFAGSLAASAAAVQTLCDLADVDVVDDTGNENFITNAVGEQARSLAEHINTWQNDAAQELSPQTPVADHQDDLKPIVSSQHEERVAEFQVAGLSDGSTTDDELLRFPESHGTVCDGHEISTVYLSAAFEGINHSAVTESSDFDSFVMLNEDGGVIQQLNQPASSVAESCQCAARSAKVQQDQRTSAVDDSLVAIVDHALVFPDSLMSVHIQEELGRTDADTVAVADNAHNGTMAHAGMTGDIAMSASADTAIVPAINIADSASNIHTFDAAVGCVDGLLAEHASDWRSARDDKGLAVARLHIDSDAAAGCVVPTAIDSGESDVTETLSAPEPETAVELTNGLEDEYVCDRDVVAYSDAVEQTLAVSHQSADTSSAAVVVNTCNVDTDVLTAAVNVTEVTTTLLNGPVAAASCAHWTGKVNDTESAVTVSDQTASSSAAGKPTGTDGNKSAASFDFSLIDTDTVLLRLPSTDVSRGADSVSGHAAGTSGLNMLKSEEGADITSLGSEKCTVNGTGDSREEQSAVICDAADDTEHAATSCIQVASTCKHEAVKYTAVVDSGSTIAVAESMLSPATGDIYDEHWHSTASQHKPANGNAVTAKQTEFTELPSRLGSAEDARRVTVTNDACGDSATGSNAFDKNVDHADTDDVAEKVTVTENDQKCVGKKHKDIPVHFVSLLPEGSPDVDSDCRNIVDGDQVATDACGCEVVEEISNITDESTWMAEVRQLRQKFFHFDNAADTYEAGAVRCTNKETPSVVNNAADRAESVSAESEACIAVQGSKVLPVISAAVDMPADPRSELQAILSEPTALCRESYELPLFALEFADALHRQSDDEVFCDGGGSGSVDLNSVTNRQCIAALDEDGRKVVDEAAAMDNSESWRMSAEADTTTVSESCASLQAAVSYTDSDSLVSGTVDRAVVLQLAKNISDITTDAWRCAASDDKETDIGQQLQSQSDDEPNQVTPVVVSSVVARVARVGGDVGETALISVMESLEHPPGADETIQIHQLLASKCLDNNISPQQLEIAASAGACEVDESDMSAALFCQQPTLLSSVQPQTAEPVSTPLHTEIQLFETTNSLSGELSNTTWRDDVVVGNEAFCDRSGSLRQEILGHVSLLEVKDTNSDTEQLLSQRSDSTIADHVHRTATLRTAKEAGTSSGTILQAGQAGQLNKTVDSLVDEESSGSLTSVLHNQDRSEGYDEMAKEGNTRQEWPVVLGSSVITGPPEQETVFDEVSGTALLHIPEDIVTSLLEGNTKQHHGFAQEITDDVHLQQVNGVGHATIQATVDAEVITERQHSSAVSGPTMSSDALDKDSVSCHQQQLVNVTATPALDTPEAVISADAAAKDQQIIGGRIISIRPVLMDESSVVNSSELGLSENTQCKIDSQHVLVMEGDDDGGVLFAARNSSFEHSLPAVVSCCVQVQNAAKCSSPTSTFLCDRVDTTKSHCYTNDASNMPDASSIGITSAVDFGVVQVHVESPAGKNNRNSPFSASVADARFYQPSDLPGVLNGGSSGVVEGTGEVDRNAGDLMVPAFLQHDMTVTREQCSYELLLLTSRRHDEDVGISTSEIELPSRGYSADKTDREASGFYEDNCENGENADADRGSVSNERAVVSDPLSGDDCCPTMNDSVLNASNNCSEHLATATDAFKVASYDPADVNVGEETPKVKDTAVSHIKCVASARPNVSDMQRTGVASLLVNDDGMMSVHTAEQTGSLDQQASENDRYVCASVDVPPVVDNCQQVLTSSHKTPIPNVESACAGRDQLIAAHKLDHGEYCCEQTSSPIQPQLAVSHPSRTESVRAGSMQTSSDRTGLRRPPSRALQSAACADSLAVQLKSVDGKLQQRPGSLKSKKRELTDTEVLGIDVEPEKQRGVVESPPLQSPHVEIITSGHSAMGLGRRRTDFEYHSIGLQPVGTQRPTFTPGPDQVLRDDVTEPYPESFWHSALDIEIKPQDRAAVQETWGPSRHDAEIAPRGTYVTGAAAAQNHNGVVTYRVPDITDTTDVCTQAKDTQLNHNKDPLRGECVTTDREAVGRQSTVGDASSLFNDSLVDMLQGLSNGMPDHITVNRDATSSHISHQQFPAVWRPAGRSQIYNVGIDLFRSKSVEHVDFASVQSDGRRVRSHSDLSFISARRSCRRRRQTRRLTQPMSAANSTLSKSDQELLGSTSALFEDLLPNFKDLPFCSSVDGSDSETDEAKLIRGESERFENVLLPRCCNLSPVPGNDADNMREVWPGSDPAVRIAGKAQCDDADICNDLFVGRRTFETDRRQPTVASECRNHGDTLKHAAIDDQADRTQSMDSITYVFVGHGASSLEAVGDNRPGMVRFSSEPSSYLCEDAGLHRPVDSHTCGMLTESSSDSCLLSTDTDNCQTLTQRSVSCTGLHHRNADSGGFSDEFTSAVWTGYQQLPTAMYQSESKHTDAGSQTLYRDDASLATFGLSEIAVQTNESLNESHAKQPSLSSSSARRSQAETQTYENHQQYLNDTGDTNPLTFHADGSGKHFVHGDKSETAENGRMVQSETVHLLASTAAAGCRVSRTYAVDDRPVDESFLSNEQSIVGAYRQVPQSGDDDSRRSMTSSHGVENRSRDGIPARTQSLPYMVHQLPARHISRSSSIGRTIETQTYPQMRVIETQTASDRKTCGTQTQTLYSSDVESGDQIAAWMSIPLTVSSPSSSQELDTSAVDRPIIEFLYPSTCAVASLPSASNVPVITIDPEPPSRPVVGSFTADQPPVTAVSDAVPHQVPLVAVLTDTDTVNESTDRLCERSSGTTVRTSHHSLSEYTGLLHATDTQTARAGSVPSLHSPLSGERFPSSGSDLTECHGPVRTIHGGTSTDSAVVASTDLTCDIHSTQAAFNRRRLLVENTTDRNLQRSARPAGGLVDLLLSSRPDQTAHVPTVAHSGSRQSDSSAGQSPPSALSPASSREQDVIRSQHSTCRRTQEEEENSKSVADEILEKYRTKRTGNAERVVLVGDERSVFPSQCDNCAQSAFHSQRSSSYSHANDSGIVDSWHSLSPLTRTLLGCSNVSCDKSTITETGRRTTAGWYDELDRLRSERQQIIDMLSREVIPSRIQVQLAEAHLNYLIGQTDSLLQRAGDESRDVLEADFGAFCRARLEASQRHTEAQIQRLERLGNEARIRTPPVATHLGVYGQRDALADVRKNVTPERRCTARQPVRHLCSCTCSPSEREQFLLGVRREIVSATTTQPVPAIHSSTSRLHTGSLRSSLPHRGHSSAHSSCLNLGPDHPLHEEQPRSCRSSLTVTPAASLQHLNRRRHSLLASSIVDEEITALLTECREARQRAHVEIGRALDAIQRTSPSWSSSSRSSRRYSQLQRNTT